MNQDSSCQSFFVVTCPGCRRRVSVALSNLGKNVTCLRCLTQFPAVDPQCRSAAEDDPMKYWAEFTDREDLDGDFGSDGSDPSRLPR